MNGFKTAMGILVGVLLGIANWLGFKNITVGIVVAVCFSVLFVYIFHKHPRKNRNDNAK